MNLPFDNLRGHKLVTAEMERTIPKFYSQEDVADPIAHAKFFLPGSSYTYLVLELDVESKIVFGWCLLDHPGMAELGYSSMIEIAEMRLRYGSFVERDLYWEPKPLSEAKLDVLRAHGWETEEG